MRALKKCQCIHGTNFQVKKYSLRTMFKLHRRGSCRDNFHGHRILTVPCIYIYDTSRFVKKYISLFYCKVLRKKVFSRLPQYKTNCFKKQTMHNSVKFTCLKNFPSKIKEELLLLQNSK